jgi:ribonuclease BN (tRNA processing enzyme)
MPFVSDGKYQQFGHFYIKAFELPHGDTKSYGFYIRHEEIGQLLFLTDFEYCEYDFSKLNVEHILIECNYDLQYIDVNAPNFKHKVQGHCSLETCKEFIKHNNNPCLRNVVLIHGSETTLNSVEAVKAIESIVTPDVCVKYAYKGLEMELKKECFE